ncbi:PfaD family polyunsaturated fatty acid/polyketide biosynthesis protein [Desulfospira joergensenii]|uniref:PfaD family polyunsaturated fatty acid/polyketide biosynthesis protein n=1 Tax=Desulfospira joergensenii TaxID=53329 RepID=UPI0003B5C167|nr:PfaD family polyunsaturated fatty acid/polyketide biosynthesis protein [Desulfospira joergensenii]
MSNNEQIKNCLYGVSEPVYVTRRDENLLFSNTPPSGVKETGTQSSQVKAFAPAVDMESLGDKIFKKRHGLRYAYVAGAMANGISSVEMVKAMAESGMLGVFGAGGLSLDQIEKAVVDLKTDLGEKPFGFNLIHSLGDPGHEMATVNLYLKHGIRRVSAAAFMRMTPALVLYRVKGLHTGPDNEVVAPNQVIAKVSRIEVARQFFSPPPQKIVTGLLEAGLISDQEAKLSEQIPMAWDLTAEADSGGHTDNRPALALLPTMISLKNQFMEKFKYRSPLCVGLAGGIATPESAAAAFSMGAAYILTGSVNQSCMEAGISEEVRKLLCQAEQADVAMAPAADMFEIGARVQVLKRGTMFPVRAEKLFQIYKNYDDFDQVPEKLQKEIEDKFLLKNFEAAWQSTRDFFLTRGNPKEIEKAEESPKHKMALVFRSYLGQSSRWAIQGTPERKMDFQIWCGPSMGAFNQWVKAGFLESHENRRTAEIGLNLMFGACISTRAMFLRTQGISLPREAEYFTPLPKKEILDFNSPSS